MTDSRLFDTERYYSYLKTCSLGRPCLYLDKVDSTINVASKERPNTLVLAEEQTKGRGQRNNAWQSPKGCAMGSIRMMCKKTSALGTKISFLQHLVALAIVNTLEQIDSTKLNSDKLKLKWPNDIIYEPRGKKIGGILVLSNDDESNYDLTLSFGLNVSNQEPTTCIQEIVGSSKTITIDLVVAGIMNTLESYTSSDINDDTWQYLKSEYSRRCIQINKIVQDEINGPVMVESINDHGFLVGKRCSDLKQCIVTKIMVQ